MRWGLVFVNSAALVAACSPTASSTRGAASLDATSMASCDDAFRVWVDGAASLNSPDMDLRGGGALGENALVTSRNASEAGVEARGR